jgi:hypothetical protein
MVFDIKKWLALLQIIAPIVLTVAGVPAGLVGDIVAGIGAAEAIPGAVGAAKKASVVAVAQAALDATPTLSADQKANALDAVGEGIDTTIAIVNAVHKAPVTPVVPVV